MKSIQRIFLILMLFQITLASSQSIRKDYREMTEREKINLVNAFYQLRLGPDLFNNLRAFHQSFGSQLHFQLPNNPSNDSFLAWHRMALFELEQAMQDLDPSLSIPFWNSIEDQGVNSALWDTNFLGQFDDDWNINRNFGNLDLLPTQNDWNIAFANTNWLNFSNTFERGRVHAGAHRWVGGLMPTHSSPGDPVFYLHHAFVDKLWQDWEETYQASSYLRTSLLRYDGTFSFNGELLPAVNPNDIVNSRALGVFYGESGLAVLDQYTVQNTHRPVEHFYYQFRIEAGNNFIIPSNSVAVMESVNEVVLKPGFTAASGSDFTAQIDADTDLQQMLKYTDGITRVVKPYEGVDLSNIMDFDKDAVKIEDLQFYPNPFTEYMQLRLSAPMRNISLQLVDFSGRVVYTMDTDPELKQLFTVNGLSFLSRGAYVLRVLHEGEVIHNVKVLKSR